MIVRCAVAGLVALSLAGGCGSAKGGARARFVPVNSAVVRDTAGGLEWTRHDDGAGLDWHRAEAYCRELSIDGTQGWRLPSVDELRPLYDTAAHNPCGDVVCRIDPVFTLTSPYVWSATAQGDARTYMDFEFGTALSPTITPRLLRRTLCVRPPA